MVIESMVDLRTYNAKVRSNSRRRRRVWNDNALLSSKQGLAISQSYLGTRILLTRFCSTLLGMKNTR